MDLLGGIARTGQNPRLGLLPRLAGQGGEAVQNGEGDLPPKGPGLQSRGTQLLQVTGAVHRLAGGVLDALAVGVGVKAVIQPRQYVQHGG